MQSMAVSERHHFRQLMLSFGECILYKFVSKGTRMGAKWLEGVCFGYSRSSNAYVIASAEGLPNARSTYRRPMRIRWSCENITDFNDPVVPSREGPCRYEIC